jgi:N-acyl-D-amino-acid deacylase
MIKEQFWADIVVFDPEKVNDTAAYNNPHHYATGIPFVLVNGVPIIKFNTPARSLASD